LIPVLYQCDDPISNSKSPPTVSPPDPPKTDQYINVPDDYQTIQEAIDSAVKGETILVAPGTYYENINFNGKEITLASKFIIDQNEEHISNTIIDGGNEGRVVDFYNGETNLTKLIGFTIQRGENPWDSGESIEPRYGGGIACFGSSPILEHLIITNNFAIYGGGIFMKNSQSIINDCYITNNQTPEYGAGIAISDQSSVEIYNTRISKNLIHRDNPNSETVDAVHGAGIGISESNVYLSNVSIHDNSINHFQGRGAGIELYSGQVTFDKNNRSNLYNNTLAQNDGDNGSDIHSWYTGEEVTEVYLDTFTVLIPTDFYAYPSEYFIFDIQNAVIDQPLILSDYFVDPDGSNSNSGASANDPLKTISYILNNIQVSPGSITIHLANGIYSPTSNGEQFPLILSSNISIIGESEQGVLINAQNQSTVFIGQYVNNCLLSDLTITNGYGASSGGGLRILDSNINFKNVTVTGCSSDQSYGPTGGGMYMHNTASIMDSVTIKSNASGGLKIGGNSKLTITNSSISSNNSDEEGCGIIIRYSSVDILNVIIQGNRGYYHSAMKATNSVVNLSNVLIFGNIGGLGFKESTVNILNCTIANNSLDDDYEMDNGGIINLFGGNVTFTNTIIWNEPINNLSFLECGYYGCPQITISNSDLKGGKSGIFSDGTSTLNWLDGNIDGDPLFLGSSDFHLQSGSPCIDAGNPDPQYNDHDGSRNDMGAYGGPGGDW
jgi:hypothetical protein